MTPREFPPQFLTYKTVDRPDGGTDKLPTDPRTGEVCDAHDPLRWVTYQVAADTGRPVAFVLTENDPLFLLDLDKCREGESWSAEAQTICAPFMARGAGCEVSQSGNGLHIIASCDPALGRLLRNRHRRPSGLDLEFYTQKRFIALGSHWQGSAGATCDDVLTALIPARGIDPDEPLPEGRDPDWSGPEDDDELIARMLRSQGGAARMFGNKASIAELWNATGLERFFPAPERDGGVDLSSADAALMAHLAFWTGKDSPRMDRLFRRSALVRDKYIDRPDYQVRTISGAIQQCRAVLSSGAGSKNTGQEFANNAPTPQTQDKGAEPNRSSQEGDPTPDFGETIFLHQLGQFFSGCVAIEDRVGVLCPDGHILTRDQFKLRYGGHMYQLSNIDSKTTKCAWEAFTQNRAIDFPKVRTAVFRPDLMPLAVTPDGQGVNIYVPPFIPASDASLEPFFDHLGRLLPNERDQRILLSWMAFVAQNPGRQAMWAIMLQGMEGNGKTFFMRALEHAVGKQYAHFPTAEDMGEKFNAYIEGKILIGVEEIHMEGRRSLMDRLKPLITNSSVEVRAMQTDKRMVDNATNWFFTSNHLDAIFKTRGDRRYAIFYTAQQNPGDLERDRLDGDYFPELWDWARAGGFDAVAHWLKRVEIPDDMNPTKSAHRAPVTSSHEQAIEESRGPMEVALLAAIEAEEQGFRGGFISSARAAEVIKSTGVKYVNPKTLRKILNLLGYFKIGRAPIIFEEGGARPYIYAKSENYRINDYFSAQNYKIPDHLTPETPDNNF